MRHTLLGMTLLGTLVLLNLVVLGSAAAEPLDSSRVARDAQWVMHMDFDAFRETALAKHIREEHLKPAGGDQWFDWVRDRYGIDLRKDLHGLTFYGRTYQPHQGVALLIADFDKSKVIDVIKNEPSYQTSTYGDYTLHTWEMRDKKHHGKHHGDKHHGDKDKHHDKDHHDKDKHKHGDKEHAHNKDKHHDKKDHDHHDGHKGDHKDKDAHDKKHDHKHDHKHDKKHGEKSGDHKHGKSKMITAAFTDGVVVMAGSQENVQRALDVLNGKAESLGDDAELVADGGQDAVFYGAATNLSELKQHAKKEPPQFALLRQGQSMQVALGEKDNQAFYRLRFTAQSNEIAQQMEKIVAGFQAMLQLQANAHKQLQPIVEGLSFQVDGKQLHVDWKADAQQTVDLIHKMAERHREKWDKRHSMKDKDHEKYDDREDDDDERPRRRLRDRPRRGADRGEDI